MSTTVRYAPAGATAPKRTYEPVEVPFCDAFYVCDTGSMLLVEDCEGEEYVILPGDVREHLVAILGKMERIRTRAYQNGVADGKAEKAREIKHALGL